MATHPDTIRLQKAQVEILILRAEIDMLRQRLIVLDPYEAKAVTS